MVKNTNHNYNKRENSIEKLKKQFIRFARNVAILVTQLPTTPVSSVYGKHAIRCSGYTSINYRVAGGDKSQTHAWETVKEGAEEFLSFLEVLLFFNREYKNDFESLIKERNELLAITIPSIKNSKQLIFNTNF